MDDLFDFLIVKMVGGLLTLAFRITWFFARVARWLTIYVLLSLGAGVAWLARGRRGREVDTGRSRTAIPGRSSPGTLPSSAREIRTRTCPRKECRHETEICAIVVGAVMAVPAILGAAGAAGAATTTVTQANFTWARYLAQYRQWRLRPGRHVGFEL